jgi:iron complex transport system ATP-binding protein
MTEIILDNVTFGYSEDHPIIQNINLKIDEPGLYCILGPNGVGKSTLVKCVNKILVPTSGKVTIDGVDVEEMTHAEISKYIGYVPVSSNEAFAMSVLDTIMIGRYNHRRWGSEHVDLEMVYRAMKLLRIRNLANRNYNALSAGQHQKVSIARGIVQETPVLILDEPTANLDVKYQVYVMELLRAFAEKKGVAVLTISHDLNITAKYAHKIIMLARPGVVYKVGDPNEVLTKENVETVYGIACEVHDNGGYPLLVFGGALLDDDDLISDKGSFQKEESAFFALKNALKAAIPHHHKEHHPKAEEPPAEPESKTVESKEEERSSRGPRPPLLTPLIIPRGGIPIQHRCQHTAYCMDSNRLGHISIYKYL